MHGAYSYLRDKDAVKILESACLCYVVTFLTLASYTVQDTVSG